MGVTLAETSSYTLDRNCEVLFIQIEFQIILELGNYRNQLEIKLILKFHTLFQIVSDPSA